MILFDLLICLFICRRLQGALIYSIGDLFLGIDATHTSQYAPSYLEYLRLIQSPELFGRNRNQEGNEDNEDNDDEDEDNDDEDDEDLDTDERDDNLQLIESIIVSYTSVVQVI